MTGKVSPVPAAANRELYLQLGGCDRSRRVRIALADDGTFRIPVAAHMRARRNWTLVVRIAPRGDHTDAASRTLYMRSRLKPICVIHTFPT